MNEQAITMLLTTIFTTAWLGIAGLAGLVYRSVKRQLDECNRDRRRIHKFLDALRQDLMQAEFENPGHFQHFLTMFSEEDSKRYKKRDSDLPAHE